MLLFSLGVALGFLIKPAMRYYYNYSWYRNFRRYSFKQSFTKSFEDIWS